MDENTQAVACVVIYSGSSIVSQGSFQVFEALNMNTLQSTDGGEFTFTHSCRDMLCDLEASYSQRGSVVAKCNLAVPINRSKIKWKRCKLNGRYTIHYRCQLEDWNSGKLRKERNKLRRKAVTRGWKIANAAICRAGD
jgi:hypothetical protein